ncbi:MAG: hypothetical protein A07HB70_01103 [uncultured archaeon A07HB70]|nr:MAG: hypothetical protein A07HB70_01103 [uncultured archaeon A07HB70]
MFHNRDGEAVDPWPFVAVAGTGVLPVLSFGPLYLTALGLSLSPAIGVCLAVSAAVVAGAYHRLVYARRPGVAGAAGDRFARLFYAALVLVGVLALLALPLLGRSL